MGSKVALTVAVLASMAAVLALTTTGAHGATVPEQRSHTDLAELDSSEEERPGAIDRVKDFFGDLSTKVKEGVQDGVVKVKAGVKQGASKAKEYASNVRDYFRDTFSSKETETAAAAAATTTATATTATTTTAATIKVPLADH